MLFYKTIQGLSRAMHVCTYNHWLTHISDGQNFFLALSSVAHLRVSRKFLLLSERFKFCLSYFYFYKVHDSTPWPFGNSLEDSDLFLSVSLDGLVSDIFRVCSEVVWGDWMCFPRKLDLRFCPNLPNSLISCFRFDCSSGWAVLAAVLCDFHPSPGYLLKRGSNIFVGTSFPLQLMYREVFSLTSFLVVPWQRRSRGCVLPSIQH